MILFEANCRRPGRAATAFRSETRGFHEARPAAGVGNFAVDRVPVAACRRNLPRALDRPDARPRGGSARSSIHTGAFPAGIRLQAWQQAIDRGIESGLLGLGPGPHLPTLKSRRTTGE